MAVLINGLRPAEPGLEFYRVAPGGATEVAIRGDDRVRVIDRHGGQTAELTANGGGGLAALGLHADAKSAGTTVFGRDSRPGSDIELIAQGDTVLVVSAPGGRVVDGDTPATELLVEVRRANPATRGPTELPAPLAEPRLDFRVDRASALSYEVKQGEYIQVIDVEGQPVLGLPRLPPRQAGERRRAGPRRHRHENAHGPGVSRPPACRASSTTSTWTRSLKS